MKFAIPYTIKRHHAAKRMKLRVLTNGAVTVTLPRRASLASAEVFVAAQAAWIAHHLKQYTLQKKSSLIPKGATYHTHRLRALRLVRDKILRWNAHYRVPFKKISIRAQTTRWGSCSRSGTLSFNYKIFFLPEQLVDYIVVHELCHVREMNHSRRFWQLVAETVRDHRERRRELRSFHLDHA